jgi:predicted nucleic acid-binding protein
MTPELRVAEPPPRFRVRPPLVVDCSVVAALLFDEAQRDAAEAAMTGSTLFAPVLLDAEMVSVSLRKATAGGRDLAVQALADYAALEIDRRPVDVQSQLELALRYRISAYDAAYLALAAELRAPLATFDAGLAQAAARHFDSLG